MEKILRYFVVFKVKTAQYETTVNIDEDKPPLTAGQIRLKIVSKCLDDLHKEVSDGIVADEIDLINVCKL